MFIFNKNEIINTIDKLKDSQDQTETWNNAVKLSEAWGCNALNIGTIDLKTSSLIAGRSSMSDAWLDEYVSEAYFETDPLIRSFNKKTESFTIFSENLKEAEEDERSLYSGLVDANYNIVHGTKSVKPGSDIGKMVVLSFDRQSMNEENFDSLNLSVASLLIGAFVNTEIADNKDLFYSKATTLTAREIEVLSFLAQGLQTTAISYKMKIAEITVNKHFFNAKRKLGAKTREEALFIAMKYGYISL